MFKTRRKFKKLIIYVVKDGDKWYCRYGDTCRQGDTKEQAIENAYQMWKGKGKK